MDYKEKYEQALERCKKEFNFKNLAYSHEEIKQRLECVFPELKESEDERIREEILNCFRTMKQQGCFPSKHKEQYDSWIAWLEKRVEQEQIKLPNGEDYGIDSLYHAARILEKTLGEVDGYQSDDGILEHKCAIEAVKRLYKQKPSWSEDDKKKIELLIAILKINHPNGQFKVNPTNTLNMEAISTKELVNWLKSIRERMKGE